MRIFITTAFGLEAVVARELEKMGYSDIATENGRITLNGSYEDVYRLNVNVSAGERVLICVGEFRATSFDQLFDNTKHLPWEYYIPANGAIPVDAKSVNSALFSLSDCQRIVKKAIVERLKTGHSTSTLPETGPRYPVIVSIHNDIAQLMIDTSGDGLHKRGWRAHAGDAPLKETLANAMAALSFWRPERPLIDPMCGSGTILIESALREMHVAPGHARSFVCDGWKQLPFDLTESIRREAAAKDRSEQIRPMLDICGYDIDRRVLETARRNAKDAGVADIIHFQQRDFAELSSKKQYGCIITNPPYGERIGDKSAIKKIYSAFRNAMKELPTWSFYVLTADENFENEICRKADKKRKLYIGRIKVDYYQFYGPRPPKKDN
ncbi:MAG: class I SAM-dependent RNA methyltransferase [Clostridia bacterium]|nr:class I SAM-dependent RNA methyltransferase [Clostridia bacterium]